MIRVIPTLFVLMLTLPLFGQLTYTKDIAPIIYENCSVCHREGEIGPMALTNYNEVKTWAGMVQYVTSIKYMPPWKADKDYSQFMGERGLTDEEIQKIADWVDAGMPMGDPADEPELPDFPKGSQIGEPDLQLSFAQPYIHQGNNQDQYQIIVIPTGLQEQKVVKAVELRPGNAVIVHHALIGLDTTGAAAQLDEDTPEYGYPGFGGFGVDLAASYPTYVPGAKPRYFPEGMGQLMFPNSDLLLQMHYAPVPVEESDSSTINIFFAEEDEQVTRYVQEYVMLPFLGTLLNGPFWIPANQVRTFHGVFTLPYKVSLLGLGPHMHLLGKDWEVYAVHPDGDTTNLISIPEWDFNWQGYYFFPRFIVLEPGTEIHALATYDNTADNPLNPNNPPQNVTWGEGTADEMYYLPFLFVDYAAGDEDVVFEEDVVSSVENLGIRLPENKLYPPYPNPGRQAATVGFELAKPTRITLRLTDLNGHELTRLIDNQYLGAGRHMQQLNLQGLEAGAYFIQLSGKGFQFAERLLRMP